MDAKGIVKFSEKIFKLKLDTKSQVDQKFITHLPISSIANNIGGEIYFRVPDVDIDFDGTQCQKFDVGDIVYWRSPIGEKKFSIAMIYGNTQYSNWKSPLTSDPCVKIGRFIDSIFEFADIDSGVVVTISIE
jgi:hypothetical protein